MSGTSTEYLLWLAVVTAGVTFLLRALPFLFFGTGKRPPALVLGIGSVLSPAAIAMLVVYCFASYADARPPADHMFGLAEIAAAVVVVALQLWKRNPLLSILAGTAVYMTLVQTVVPTRGDKAIPIQENAAIRTDGQSGEEQPGQAADANSPVPAGHGQVPSEEKRQDISAP